MKLPFQLGYFPKRSTLSPGEAAKQFLQQPASITYYRSKAMNKAVVLFSGGQDSTTCLAWAVDKYGKDNVLPVMFEYGQKHAVEMVQATKISGILGVASPYVISVEALSQFGAAALTNTSIDVEAQASKNSGNTFAQAHGLPSTFVPGRNMIFLSLAAAYGAQNGVYKLVTGVCEADDAGYPDCRVDFINAMENAVTEALNEPQVSIEAPLLFLSKADTFEMARQLGVLDVVVEHSHTCYNGDRSIMHDWGAGCGECPACKERAKGWGRFQREFVDA